MRFYALYGNFWLFRPKRFSFVLSITESFGTSPLVIWIFQIKICDFKQNTQNFEFHPKRPSSVLSITVSAGTSPLVILVFQQIKICNFMQNMQNFDFSPKNGPVPCKVSQCHLKPPHWLFRCPRSKYASLCKHAKFSYFTEHGPALF